MKNMKNIMFAGALLAMLFTAGCVQQQQEKGILSGHVTIGPLCPVEPCNATPEQIARTYEARKIIVYAEDGKSVVEELSIGKDGNYLAELDPGNYVVDIRHAGIDRSAEVPRKITIEPGKRATVDISIDTGIR